ncbi:hypothetical protein [Vibrio mexicanus]|uniref:hypothetical protein n=1 Tax=Vibrio mexicanus TaxID=1004326 RepID=UPI00063C5169|nr:hypothetical protein [Vibrio mexicanus]
MESAIFINRHWENNFDGKALHWMRDSVCLDMGGILWLPTSGIDSSLANEWNAYLIMTEEVLSLVCLILVGKIVIYDLKRSVKPSS